MSSSLSHIVEGVPERFVPAEMRGQLVEAEHMARYWWASAVCRDRRVLDVGCGVGYGAALLKQAGAAEVVAVDVAEAVIEVARQEVPEGVLCEVADARSLPYGDGSFDLVVCLETIEHVEDPDRVLDELARVVRRDGLLLISSPNRNRYVPGNPHHRHEYTPPELRAALERRFPAVRLIPQHAMLASVIGSDLDAEVLVRPLVDPSSEDEIYTLAIAGGELPPMSPAVVALTQFLEIRHWLERYEGQQRVLDEQEVALREMDELRRERQQALELLAEREEALSELPLLRDRQAAARGSLVALEEQLAQARAAHEEVASAARIADDMRASVSWRITAPLRRIKALAGRLRRR